MSSPEHAVAALPDSRFVDLANDNACLRAALKTQAEGAAEQMVEILRLRRRIEDLEQTNRDLARRGEAQREELAELKFRVSPDEHY